MSEEVPVPYEGRRMSKSRDLSVLPNQSLSFKNRIINGAMQVWQRGTSFSNPSVGGNFYTADRWAVNRSGDASGATVSRSTDVPTGFQFSLRLQRTAGDTSTAGLFLFNSNETVNTLDLAGELVTLSFWAKTGANYSGGVLNAVVRSGTGTDQRVFAYTGSATVVSTNITVNGTWTRYAITGQVPSNSTEVGFQLSWTPSGTAGADDSVYLTGFQLEKGSQATSFDYRPYGTELALCQRYFAIITNDNQMYRNHGFDLNTSRDRKTNLLPVTMRSTPTMTITTSGVFNDGGSTEAGASMALFPSGVDQRTVYSQINYTSQRSAGVFNNGFFSATANSEL